MYKFDESDLLSLEMDIASIRHAGGVEEYLEKREGDDYPDYLITKLERLINALKGGNAK